MVNPLAKNNDDSVKFTQEVIDKVYDALPDNKKYLIDEVGDIIKWDPIGVVREALLKAEYKLDPAWYSWGTIAPKKVSHTEILIEQIQKTANKEFGIDDIRSISRILTGDRNYLNSFIEDNTDLRKPKEMMELIYAIYDKKWVETLEIDFKTFINLKAQSLEICGEFILQYGNKFGGISEKLFDRICLKTSISNIPIRDWKVFKREYNNEFQDILREFRGDYNLDWNGGGGEGKIFTSDRYKDQILKRWFGSEIYKFEKSVRDLENVRKIVKLKKEGAEKLGESVSKWNLEGIWQPMGHGTPPGPDQYKEYLNLFKKLHSILESGGSIYVHCSAGIHRTGMIVFALLLHLGFTELEAIKMLFKLRKITHENVGEERVEWGKDLLRYKDIH